MPTLNSYAETKKTIQALQKAAYGRITPSLDVLKQIYPQFSKDYGIKLEIRVYKKQPTGSWNIPQKIVEKMLCEGGLEKTQKVILEDLKNDFPDHKLLPNIWNRTLQRGQLKKIKEVIQGSSYANANIASCKKLAGIRKALKTYIETTKPARTFKTEISFTPENVIVGNQLYPITWKKSGGYEYPVIRVNSKFGRIWVQVRALTAMLQRKRG